VVAGYIDRPGPGLELAKLKKDSKLFTSSGLYVLYCHITDLKMLDNINANSIDVLENTTTQIQFCYTATTLFH